MLGSAQMEFCLYRVASGFLSVAGPLSGYFLVGSKNLTDILIAKNNSRNEVVIGVCIWMGLVPLRGFWIPIPARKRRFRRCSSVEDVHPLPPHALDPTLPRATFRQSFLATSTNQNPYSLLHSCNLFKTSLPLRMKCWLMV